VSTVFTNTLRSNREPIVIDNSGAGAITFRVESAELWDAIRVVASPDAPMSEVKRRAIEQFFPQDALVSDYVLKLHGWEILDETAPLRDIGIVEGSIVLLAVRRRRPVF
jgi:hypothetical protein